MYRNAAQNELLTANFAFEDHVLIHGAEGVPYSVAAVGMTFGIVSNTFSAAGDGRYLSLKEH